MGFVLWISEDVAWAEGTYESRSMGAAVISITDLFRHRDFRPSRRAPRASDPGYVGWFASLSDLNARLRSYSSRSARRAVQFGPRDLRTASANETALKGFATTRESRMRTSGLMARSR